jgi:[calcium/calmodulin-dependent protein kinase] kinase
MKRRQCTFVIDFFGQPVELGDWKFRDELGATGTSRVFLISQASTNDPFVDKYYDLKALRRLFFDGSPLDQIQREIRIMSTCDHPNIQKLTEVIDDPSTNTLHIIQPFATLGSLEQLAKKLPIPELRICFSQIAKALRYLHSRNIVHRDIKPSNILCLREHEFVLSDFFVASESSDLSDTQGSPAFLSPEECFGKWFDGKAADVWSFGVTLYFAAFGGFPFGIRASQEVEFVQLFMAVTQALRQNMLLFPSPVDPMLKDLLGRCLAKEASQRPSFDEIVRHEWLN